MKLFSACIAVMLSGFLVGCQSYEPKPHWVAVTKYDPFTKKSINYVTTEYLLTRGNNKAYVLACPIVGKYNGEIFFGFKSCNALMYLTNGTEYMDVSMPVSDIQVRIGADAVFDFSKADSSPLLDDVFAAASNVKIPSYDYSIAGVSGVDKKAFDESMKANTANITKTMGMMMKPYSVVTGDKAKLIIKKLASGESIIFRPVPSFFANSIASVPNDGSFLQALKDVGVSESDM